MGKMNYKYGKNNADNLTEAIRGLDIFTKNWCMDVKKTNQIQDLVFRCDKCLFNVPDNECQIKAFAYGKEREHEYPMSYFGSMGEL